MSYSCIKKREKWLLSFPIKAWRNLIVAWSISEYSQSEDKLEDLNPSLQVINSQNTMAFLYHNMSLIKRW